MSKNFIPAAIVALTALAATGSAFAHDVIVPREGFDTAIASLESQSSGSSGQVQANAQGQAQAASQQAVKRSGPQDPAATDYWWKNR